MAARLTPLTEADDAARFGGKAASLARALAAGLPVPVGYALDHLSLGAFDETSVAALTPLGPLAVRSSAIGEDGAEHSFAGQHVTKLGVAAADVVAAVREVAASAHAPSVLTYRALRGITDTPRSAVILQTMIAADVAAVVFTRDPVTGADAIVVEASYGLGESVVGGYVVPDRFRLDRTGRVLARIAGDKDSALLLQAATVVEVTIDEARRTALCLDDSQLARIAQLVRAVDGVWSGPHDLEIAFTGADLYLLQRRPCTAL